MSRTQLVPQPETEQADSRASWRIPVTLTGDLGNSRFGKRKVQLINISAGGCCVETGLELPQGTAIIVTIPGLTPIGCEVRWSTQGAIGLQFAAPLHPSVVDAIEGRAAG